MRGRIRSGIELAVVAIVVIVSLVVIDGHVIYVGHGVTRSSVLPLLP